MASLSKKVTENLFSPLLSKNKEIKQEIFENLISERKRGYFDYTASGLGYKTIEKRIKKFLNYYANTHSENATLARITETAYEHARNLLKKLFELEKDFLVIPAGFGATGAIKKFLELKGLYIPPATLNRFKKVEIEKIPLAIIGPYEHHSNELGFRESICEVKRIRLTKEGTIDLLHLEQILKSNKGREIIASFSIASNATGIISPYKELSHMLRRYGATICFDAAAASPYMNVPSELFDAMFVSPHKLIGGPGSIGLLLIRKQIVDTSIPPTYPGGGTVTYVSRKSHFFKENPEKREDAGTPPILNLIKASLAYKLRNEVGLKWLKDEKKKLFDYLLEKLKQSGHFQILGDMDADNIGIISIIPKKIGPYTMCESLSNEFGIETRAGCSCTGPYGHDLLNLEDNNLGKQKPGWLRISVHYVHTEEQMDYLVEAMEQINKYGEKQITF